MTQAFRVAGGAAVDRDRPISFTFDGVAYRDFWTWSTLNNGAQGEPVLKHPVRMLSTEDEDEVERMFQKLKSVGRLDVRSEDSPSGD